MFSCFIANGPHKYKLIQASGARTVVRVVIQDELGHNEYVRQPHANAFDWDPSASRAEIPAVHEYVIPKSPEESDGYVEVDTF